jgi:hypothetical protein
MDNQKLKIKLESSMLQSKKFVAAMLWNICWLVLIGFGIHNKIDANVLSAMVYVSGFVQMLYLGGQSAVDAFVRGAFASKAAPKIKLESGDSDTTG